jgi:hypothetical protein
MGWTKINPRAGAPGRVAPVSISIRDSGGGKCKLTIRISQEFACKGGFADNRSCRANVLVGNGPDAGKVKIEESRSGAFTVHAATCGVRYRSCWRSSLAGRRTMIVRHGLAMEIDNNLATTVIYFTFERPILQYK